MKIVLAYSGELDTSVILSRLKETYDAELIAFCADIGQEEELKGLAAKAKPKGSQLKLQLANQLRTETTMTLDWIARRLSMGTRGHLAQLLQKPKSPSDSQQQPLNL